LPDFIVALDSVAAPVRTVIGKNLDNDFARVRIEQLGEGFRRTWEGRQDEFVRSFQVDDATFEAFLAFAETRGVDVVAARPEAGDEDVLVRSEVAASRREIATRIKAFMARRLFEAEAFYPVVGQIDPVITAAMQQWRTASASLAQANR
ncbi:MAG TPA: hypothetical protein VF576_03115, partial [Rubricoccaceae bacterium]